MLSRLTQQRLKRGHGGLTTIEAENKLIRLGIIKIVAKSLR